MDSSKTKYSKKMRSTKENYDPYEHRNVENPITYFESISHFLKGSLSSGILAMPAAFYHAGYIFGFIFTILIGFIYEHCYNILIKAEYELCKRRKIPSLTFSGTAKAAFEDGPGIFKKISPYFAHLVNVLLIIFQTSKCCLYLLFVSNNIRSILGFYDIEISIISCVLLLILTLILINTISNLKSLAPLSVVGNIATFVSVAILLYYFIMVGPTLTGRDAFGELERIPYFFMIVPFSIEAIGVIFPLENNMHNPVYFGEHRGVLHIGVKCILILNIGVGFLGYLAFGSNTLASILLNLPHEEILTHILIAIITFAIFISYSLQCFIPADIIWNEYLKKKYERSISGEYFFRILIIYITGAIALLIPFIDIFSALIGSICLSNLIIIFPALIDITTFWYNGYRSYHRLFKNLCLILFGVFILVVTTYLSILEIIQVITPLEFNDSKARVEL